jgi:hypothetical protein
MMCDYRYPALRCGAQPLSRHQFIAGINEQLALKPDTHFNRAASQTILQTVTIATHARM